MRKTIGGRNTKTNPFPKVRRQYGIAEWFGRDFARMSQEDRAYLAHQQRIPKEDMDAQPCPFQSSDGNTVFCKKPHGMCSVRPYTETTTETGKTVKTNGPETIVTICPARVREGRLIYKWVAEELIGTDEPLVVPEVGFLDAVQIEGDDDPGRKGNVGRIDNILVLPGGNLDRWCALEVQAVYLSGPSVNSEWKPIEDHAGDGIPFPAKLHRPDFRSSGPKRLMPQLQTKVPSLRRWGKKMGVVIDEAFYRSLGPMDDVKHVSNSDIVWFVVGYEEGDDGIHLVRKWLRNTTLERAVEGLTGGLPVSMEEFERRIRLKPALSVDEAAIGDLD